MWVLYIYILIVFIAVAVFVFLQKDKVRKIKRNGVMAEGIIVCNEESNSNSRDRLGGNINNPVIKFVTQDGHEIIGRPVSGFISQHEVSVLDKIAIIYDQKNPSKFYIVEI